MPGDKSTGATTTTNTPAQGMTQLMSGAKGVFDSGNAWQPNTTSQVTPFSTATNKALAGMTGVANQSIPAFSQNFNNIAGLNKDGGLNDLQDQQVGRLQGMAGGNGFNATQQSAADYLNPIASGAARQNNPYLEDLISRGSQDIGNSANLMASAAGRYGSDSHAGALGKQIGDFAGNTRFADYNNQQNRQDSAIQNLFGMGTTGQGQKNDAIGSLFNAGTQQRQNIANGTGQLTDAYSARLQPYQTLSQVGAKNEDLYSRTLADKSRIFSDTQNSQTAPINWLANLLGAAGGGQTVTNTSQPSGGLKGGVGGALAGYDTFGGPLGALFGGGLGALL